MKAEPTVEDIFNSLLEMQKVSSASFSRLEAEVKDLRENRLRPYLTTAAAFLAVTMGVMGYVYNLETRLTAMLFTMNAEVSVTDERIDVLEDRLHQRTENIQLRWESHTDVHRSLSEGMRLLLEEILDYRVTDGDGDGQ